MTVTVAIQIVLCDTRTMMLPPVHLALLGGAGFDPAEQTAALSALTPGEQLDCPEECTALLRTVLALGARTRRSAREMFRNDALATTRHFLPAKMGAVSGPGAQPMCFTFERPSLGTVVFSLPRMTGFIL